MHSASRNMLPRIQIRNIIRHVQGTRQFYRNSTIPKQDVTEVEIPVPWGKIAGKWWGPKDRQPILALHGWQDNAGSFDKLVPLLPKGTSLLAIDLPGHGYSSWSPPGIPYSMMDIVLTVRRIVKHYEWNKVKLLGHSMGSMIVFLYSAHFNRDVAYAIGVDLVKPPSIVDMDRHCEYIITHSEDIFKIESRTTTPPNYAEEEIMHRWIKGTNYSLDEVGCRILMVRGVTEVEEERFIFSKDPRLIKYTSFDAGFTHEHIMKLAERITCPYLLIKADSSPYFQPKELVLETVEGIKKNSVDSSWNVVPGKHHLHLTHPERVANVINPFIEKYND